MTASRFVWPYVGNGNTQVICRLHILTVCGLFFGLQQVAGPIEDGSVRKQISDGDIFMDAVFSLEAISSGIL